MDKRILLLVFLISVVIIAGCSNNSNNESSNSSVNDTSENNMNSEQKQNTTEKVHLNVTALKRPEVTKGYEELEMIQKLAEGSNVEVDWTLVTADGWSENKNLMFASGDLPDALYGVNIINTQDIVKYGSDGLLIPLEDLIDEYAPNLNRILELRPEYKKAITAPDGHIYALPVINESKHRDVYDALFMNKQWLDDAGLDVPKTTDEFYNALKAFKKKDPDRIPFSFIFGHPSTYGITSMFGSFGILDSASHITLKDGEVLFAPVQPEYKEGIKYFRKLYEEGLIDKESFTQDFGVYSSKIKNPAGVGAAIFWSHLQMFSNVEESPYVALEPLIGPNGNQLWNRQLNSILSFGGFAITSSNENPEETMKWIDRSYDEDISIQMVGGPFGKTLKLHEDGTYEPIPVPEGQVYVEWRHQYTPGDNSLYASLYEYAERGLETTSGVQAKLDMLPLYEPYIPEVDETYPRILMSVEEVQTLTDIQSEIEQYVNQKVSSWIVDGGIEEQWDDFVKQLNKVGLDEYVKVYKDAYERYSNS